VFAETHYTAMRNSAILLVLVVVVRIPAIRRSQIQNDQSTIPTLRIVIAAYALRRSWCGPATRRHGTQRARLRIRARIVPKGA
jgi:hypothetical protein